MRGVRFWSAFSSIEGIWLRSFAGPFANVMPRSSKKPRNWLIRRCDDAPAGRVPGGVPAGRADRRF